MASTASVRTSDQATARTVQRIPVTVVIPTLDEAHQIAATLEQLDWADEIVVVDGGSSDQTPCIAETHGATVLRATGLTIGAQRNLGIASARNEWVLALDADERPSAELVDELAATIREPAHDAYRIRFQNFYGERELERGHWGRDWHVRLFRRRFRFLDRRVHERLEDISSVGALRAVIRHTPYRDFRHHLEKIVRYAQLGADDLRARGYRVTVWHLTGRPAWRFFREYIVFGSFRDGRFGVVTSAMSALAAFLKYAFVAMPGLTRGSRTPGGV
ncbi:MAG: glycosyltransferase family 2 protein [Gemmatimonadaceae bacterium]